MEPSQVVTLTTAILAITFGAVSLAISIFNFLRDRAKVTVLLQWDMAVTENPKYDPRKRWGLITVTNVGRRPIFIQTIAIEMPKESPTPYLLFLEAAGGKKLSEGDPPYLQVISQDSLPDFAPFWSKMRAVAFDSTGARYLSKRVGKVPSWAKTNTAVS